MEQEQEFPNVVVVTFVGHKGDETSIVVKSASDVADALDKAVKNHVMAYRIWNGEVSRIELACHVDSSGVEILRWRLVLKREDGDIFWRVDDRYANPPVVDAPYSISMPWEGERG